MKVLILTHTKNQNKLKIWTYIRYFLRSIWLRGLFNSLDLALKEFTQEKKFGIHTSKIKLAQSKEYHHYQGASYKVLLDLFKELYPQTAHCRFVDIGCGKGRAALVAEYIGYRHLTGIDLDEELVQEAQANLALYQFKANDSDIRFICDNALSYNYPNEATLYFLFNPFSSNVLSEVLKRILSQNHQDLWFVYMNPLFPEPFYEQNLQLVKTFKTKRYTEALIFRSNASAR